MSQEDGSVEMILGNEAGRVVLRFKEPMNFVAFDPQNAFRIGEAIAREAHRVKFGEGPPSDGSYIASQVKARITEELRDRLVTRVAVMLPSLLLANKSHGYLAMTIVDTVLAEVG